MNLLITNIKKYNLLFIFLVINIAGCGGKKEDESQNTKPRAEVTITTIDKTNLKDTIFLSASSFYNNKTTVVAPISGYLSEVNLRNGMNISRGKLIFEIFTKEYNALRSARDLLDSLYVSKRAGKIEVSAPSSGQVSDLNILQGQYVQEGFALCTIVDLSSLLFKLYVPIQYKSDIYPGMKCTLLLPGGQLIYGTIRNLLAKTELNSQTEVYLLKPYPGVKIPEGINVKSFYVNARRSESQVLPKSAVLSSEKLDEYWVMKLINDSVAVKTVVEIGNTYNNFIEIKDPQFSEEDRFVLSGNYGLSDTALINISEEKEDKDEK